MKILFVYPKFKKFLDEMDAEDRSFLEPIIGGFITPPSLGIPILAALTPPEHHVALLDDNLGDPIVFDTDADLVAINCFTPQATRAFELADGFRRAGKPVVMGGMFPTAMPEACLEHADAVNIGEGEPTWLDILEDMKAGRLKRIYRGGHRFPLGRLPVPDRRLFYDRCGYDWHSALIQIARGCGFKCAMCIIPEHFGRRIRFRPVEAVVNEIRGLPYEQLYIADDTLFLTDRRSLHYARSLLKALIPLKRRLFVSSTLALNTDPQFLRLLRDAGAETFYCSLNVDPVSMRALYRSEGDALQRLIDLVYRIKDLGMNFYASFGIGREWDDESIGDRILELSARSGIDTAEFFIFTPFPGSPHYSRMVSQGRLLHRDWWMFNGAHAVFKPLKMSPEKLQEIYNAIWCEFYRRRKQDHILENLGKHKTISPHPDHQVPDRLRH